LNYILTFILIVNPVHEFSFRKLSICTIFGVRICVNAFFENVVWFMLGEVFARHSQNKKLSEIVLMQSFNKRFHQLITAGLW